MGGLRTGISVLEAVARITAYVAAVLAASGRSATLIRSFKNACRYTAFGFALGASPRRELSFASVRGLKSYLIIRKSMILVRAETA